MLRTLFAGTVFAALLASCTPTTKDAPSETVLETMPLPQLNAHLVSLMTQIKDGDDQVLLRVALIRQRRLKRLAQQDPEAFFEAVLSAETVALMPEAVQPHLERHINFSGRLSARIRENEDGSVTRVYRVRGADRTWRLLEPQSKNRDKLLSAAGGSVIGSGVEIAELLVSSTIQWGKEYAFGVEPPVGAQPTAVFMVNFSDNTSEPYTKAQAEDAVFNASDSVSNRIKEFSRNTTWLTGDVYGWWTLDISQADCDDSLLINYALQKALENNIDISPYERFFIGFPTPSACGTSATIGTYPSDAVFRAGKLTNANVVTHELGHNLGLRHSHALESCDLSASDPLTSCSGVEYGHQVCTMGQSAGHGHFTPPQLERLGWLGSEGVEPITDVVSSGTYTIEGLAASSTGAKALRIPHTWDSASGQLTYYLVEYRTPVNADAFLSSHPTFTGVLISRMQVGGSDPDNAYFMIDMTPATTGETWDQQLEVGSTFTDTANGVTIKTVSANGTTAQIEVTLAAPGGTCTQANPSVSVSAVHSKLGAGETGVFNVTLTNNDSGCAPSAFAVTLSGLPATWTSRTFPSQIALPAGASTSVQLRVTSPASASPGAVAFDATVTDIAAPSRTASASTSFDLTDCVRAAPTVSISPTTLSGAVYEKIEYDLTVTNNNSGDCGDVTFEVEDYLPSGWWGNAKAVTLGSGETDVAEWQVRSASTSPTGAQRIGVVVWPDDRQRGLVSATTIYEVQPCTRNAPTVSLSPASQSGIPGEQLSYTATVTNNDTFCDDQDFDLVGTVPSGWTSSISTPTSLQYGQSKNVTFTVTSPSSGASPATYGVSVTATGATSGLSAGGSADYELVEAPDAGVPDTTVDASVDGATSDTTVDGGSPCPTCTGNKVCCDWASLACYGNCVPNCNITGNCPGNRVCHSSGLCIPPGAVDAGTADTTVDSGVPDASPADVMADSLASDVSIDTGVPDVLPPPDGSLPPPDGSLPPPDGSLPPPDGSLPPPDGSLPPPDGSLPPPDGSLPPPDGSLPPPDGSLPPLDAGGGMDIGVAPDLVVTPDLTVASDTAQPADGSTVADGPVSEDSAATADAGPVDGGSPDASSGSPGGCGVGQPPPSSALIFLGLCLGWVRRRRAAT